MSSTAQYGYRIAVYSLVLFNNHCHNIYNNHDIVFGDTDFYLTTVREIVCANKETVGKGQYKGQARLEFGKNLGYVLFWMSIFRKMYIFYFILIYVLFLAKKLFLTHKHFKNSQ